MPDRLAPQPPATLRSTRSRPARLVVLASGAGTTLQALLDATARPGFPAEVVAVGADNAGIAALARAQAAGAEPFVVAFDAYPADRPGWNRALEQAIASRAPDLVVLAGFLRVLDPQLVARFPIVNTHPSLLPAFPGVGIRAVRAALSAGVKLAGATVHWVDEGVDSGKIIAQVAVPVHDDDDADTLFARIQRAEKPQYVNAIRQLCAEFGEPG